MRKYNVKAKWLISGRLYYVRVMVDALDKKDAEKKAQRLSLPGLMSVAHVNYCGGDVELA